MAGISGLTENLPRKRWATLERSVTDLFPRGDMGAETFWSGLRPMTPDGTPIIGRIRFDNLHLNTGHGTPGGTMVCGSARVPADVVSGTKPEIPSEDLPLAKYARA